jgi:hypothetical protein
MQRLVILANIRDADTEQRTPHTGQQTTDNTHRTTHNSER